MDRWRERTLSRDEVDELVSDWQRERPDLPVEAMQVWSRVHRVAALFDAQRRRAFSQSELDGWEFDVLAALRKAGPEAKLTPGELLRLTHVTSGTMTNRIERLRTRGLLTREADAQDRRSVVISLTEDGRQRVDRAIESLVTWEEELLTSFTPEQRRELAQLLRTAQQLLAS